MKMNVRFPVVFLFLIILALFMLIPVRAERGFESTRTILLAEEPDAAPDNAGIAPENHPVLTAAPVNNSVTTPVNRPPSSPKTTDKGGQPTTTPLTITVNTVTDNQDTLHNQKQSSQHDADFKSWLKHHTLRDFFALKDRFWAGIPFYAGFWALIFVLAVLFYFLKWKHLRQPLLFISALFFGFFLGGVPNPINGIFEVLANHQVIINIVLILLPVGISLVWGRFYCGWICPLGAVQEFLNPAPERRSLPQPLDRVLKYLKYFVLIVIGYVTWHSTHNGWQSFDPSQTLFTFSGSLTAIIILVVFILTSILVSRPFCKYLCPLGALLALTSKLAPFRMRADAKKCMVCGKCWVGECPMDAVSAFNPEIDLPNIDNSECIKCSHCQKNCRKSALRVTGFKIDHTYTVDDKYTGNFD